MLKMTMMMLKNRFGVNMTIFVFLLSLLAPCAPIKTDIESDGDFSTIQKIEERVHNDEVKFVIVSGVSYIPVNVKAARESEKKLNDSITQAIDKGQFFYIGITSQSKEATTAIQALCKRQGKLGPATATSCGSESKSIHHRDIESDKCGLKLTEVFYTDDFLVNFEVIEKNLIAQYYNNCTVHQYCLNRKVGNDGGNKIGIVYLRMYEKKPQSPKISEKKPQSPKISEKKPKSPKISEKKPQSPKFADQYPRKKVKPNNYESNGI